MTETLEIVIKIPKEFYDWCGEGYLGSDDAEGLWKCIKKGVVLPKKHGRLIYAGDLDISKLVDSDIEWVMGVCDISRVQSMIDNAPTIIEADKTRSIDKTKKSNIKCEHCKWCFKSDTYCSCLNENSPKYEHNINYWNRCKSFEWRGDTNENG